MVNLHLRRDRRAGARPFNGDKILCPECGGVTLEFNTRFRVALESGDTVTGAAWICERPGCTFFRFARQLDDVDNTSVALRAESRELRARANRKLMKMRSVLERADRTFVKSRARKKRA
jgi:hypothetical protein